MQKLMSIVVLLMGIVLASPAWAHAHLVTADPPVGGMVAATDTLRLTFSEGIEIKFTKVEITGPDGKAAGPGTTALDPKNDKIVVLTLPSKLAAGNYKVQWRVVSVDTHRTEGSFSFTVQP